MSDRDERVEAAAQALCAWPSVAVDDRTHDTATHMARAALAAADAVQGGEVTIRCEPCVGTGSMESSDSTDDGWWNCTVCKGTGKRTISDRRKPQPADDRRMVDYETRIRYEREFQDRLWGLLTGLLNAACAVPVKQRDRTTDEQKAVEAFTEAIVRVRSAMRGPTREFGGPAPSEDQP